MGRKSDTDGSKVNLPPSRAEPSRYNAKKRCRPQSAWLCKSRNLNASVKVPPPLAAASEFDAVGIQIYNLLTRNILGSTERKQTPPNACHPLTEPSSVRCALPSRPRPHTRNPARPSATVECPTCLPKKRAAFGRIIACRAHFLLKSALLHFPMPPPSYPSICSVLSAPPALRTAYAAVCCDALANATGNSDEGTWQNAVTTLGHPKCSDNDKIRDGRFTAARHEAVVQCVKSTEPCTSRFFMQAISLNQQPHFQYPSAPFLLIA